MQKQSWAGILAVLVILITVNLLAGRFPLRADLTENKEHTLITSTRNLLHRLYDFLNIKVYFSRDLPSYMATLDRQVKDLLDEYSAAGDGRVLVEFIDPDSDPALAQSVQMMGIPKLQLSQYQEERAEVTTAFLGIAVQYEDKTEVVPVVQNINRLEYDLTSAVLKASSERKQVGLAAGVNAESFRGVEQILSEQYDVVPVDPSAQEISEEITTLILLDDDTLTDQALYRVDQFVMRGGRLLYLAPAVTVDLATLQARPRPLRAAKLASAYGLQVPSTLVVDAQAPLVSFDVGFVLPLSVRYPWFVQVISEGMDPENPITSDLQSMVFPWTSPVLADSSAGEVQVLARSSERSFAKGAPWVLNPQSQITPPEVFESQPVAVALRGSFTSAFAGEPVPGDSLGVEPPGLQEGMETQMVVVGSTHFADNRFLSQYQTNTLFLANAVDWMTLGDDLIAIRSRASVSRPLREVDEDKRGMLKLLAWIPVPVLVVLFGLVRARIRRNRRERDAAVFAGGQV